MGCRCFAVTRRSFILVEIVISICAMSLVIAGIMSGALLIAEIGAFSEDTAAARDRAEDVFSIMRLPADMCGYGMPREKSEYRTAFRGGAGSPFDWEGAIKTFDISVKIDGRFIMRKNGGCRISYGIPTKIYVSREATASGGSLDLYTDDTPAFLDPVFTGNPNSPKNWIISGSMTPFPCPMWLKTSSKSGSETILKLMYNEFDGCPEAISIPENERLFYMGAMDWRALVTESDFVFYVNNLRGGGNQPRRDGIVDARFEVDGSNRVLKVWLLVRGDRRHSGVKTSGIPSGWPPEYAGDIPSEARHYRLLAFSESFGLKNF
ncbi:MAG: hypothetical protein LBS93_00330 [Synergistaceae bacterium]|jgi:hypothetical protein|nr:hypothetical protein [Synergistaceae bacterium]